MAPRRRAMQHNRPRRPGDQHDGTAAAAAPPSTTHGGVTKRPELTVVPMAMIVCNITKKDAASEGWTTPDVVGVTTAGIPGTGATTACVMVAGVTAHAHHLANAACVAYSMVWLPQKMDFLRVGSP